jgi:hypothetical protein
VDFGAAPKAVSAVEGSPQALFPAASADFEGAADALLCEGDGTGCAVLFPFGRKESTITAAISATTRAAEIMNPGLVNGFCSVVLCVDSLMMNLR